MNVKISTGNSKMGKIPSISLPAGVTCITDCECNKKCYAKRLERMRPSVREAYQHNYNLLRNNPAVFWREVEASVMMSRFFRFHVSGDIPDAEYFERVVDIARDNSHCEILCFTKKYSIVNNHIHIVGRLPQNLHIIFSAWRGVDMDNPYNLPEAHVRYKDGSTTAREDAVLCHGNCTECAITDSGCWVAQSGEQIVFMEH